MKKLRSPIFVGTWIRYTRVRHGIASIQSTVVCTRNTGDGPRYRYRLQQEANLFDSNVAYVRLWSGHGKPKGPVGRKRFHFASTKCPSEVRSGCSLPSASLSIQLNYLNIAPKWVLVTSEGLCY